MHMHPLSNKYTLSFTNWNHFRYKYEDQLFLSLLFLLFLKYILSHFKKSFLLHQVFKTNMPEKLRKVMWLYIWGIFNTWISDAYLFFNCECGVTYVSFKYFKWPYVLNVLRRHKLKIFLNLSFCLLFWRGLKKTVNRQSYIHFFIC